MFCPFCKADYRAGISRCSDCSFALVESVPQNDTDPNFMVLLWNGESLPFLEAVCAELDRAEIPVATPRVEVLLRDSADRYHMKHLKTLPYVLGVYKRDFSVARKILEAVAEKTLPPILLALAAAYPEPFDERVKLAHRATREALLDATVAVFASADIGAVEFFEASLDGVDIPVRRFCLEDGTFEVRVRPEDEARARQVLEEVTRGTSSQSDPAVREDELLRDGPPQSHFLAWFVPVFGLGIWSFLLSDALADDSTFARHEFVAALFVWGGFLRWAGMFWMFYQAQRYEARPFKYYVAALIPFAFVWYYVERVMARKGVQKLPVSVRLRMPRPPAS